MKRLIQLIVISLLSVNYLVHAQTNTSPFSITPADNGKTFKDMIIDGEQANGISIQEGVENITIENILFKNCLSSVNIWKAKNITIKGCRFENVRTAVNAVLCEDIFVEYNEFLNVGHFRTNETSGNFVEFAKTLRGSVSYNVGENILGQSDYLEDIISMYKSRGEEGNPIRIIGNKFRGRGKSHTGSGIMTGDVGGAWILVKDNRLVNPGAAGICIAGGQNISIIDNLVFHQKGHEYFSNGAMYVWAVETSGCRDNPETCTQEDRWDYDSRDTNGCYYCALPCGNHTVTGNRVRWWSSAQSIYDAWWAQGNCNIGNTIDNIGFEWADGGVQGDPTIDDSILPADLFANLGDNYYSGKYSSTGFTLIINTVNGSVSKSPDKTSYEKGDTVSLTATANSGYWFDHWSGDASGTSAVVNIVMDTNKIVTANFISGDIIATGETNPAVAGSFIKDGMLDGVDCYKRNGLVGGLQYYLYRLSWSSAGNDYMAWFVSTQRGEYPEGAEVQPFWFRYFQEEPPGVYLPSDNPAATGDLTIVYGVTTSVKNKTILSNNISIYPNPSSGAFHLSFVSEYKGSVFIKVYKLDGSLINDIELMKQDDLLSYVFNIGNQPSGVYFVRLIAGDKIAQQKIIKN